MAASSSDAPQLWIRGPTASERRGSRQAARLKKKKTQFKTLDRMLEKKSWKVLLWDSDDSDPDNEYEDNGDPARHAGANGLPSSNNDGKNAAADDFTRAWHNKLVTRNVATEHRINQSKKIKEMIDTILTQSTSDGRVSDNVLSMFGVSKSTVMSGLFSLELDNKQQGSEAELKMTADSKQIIKVIATTKMFDEDVVEEEHKLLDQSSSSPSNHNNSANDTLNEISLNQLMSSLRSKTTTSPLKPVVKMKNGDVKISSMDIVAGLFHMSNELREEREQIVSRTGGNIEAFLNRDITKKYNDELEDVMQNRKVAKTNTNRAAHLRLKRAVGKHMITSEPKEDNMWTFWSTLQAMQTQYQHVFKERTHRTLRPVAVYKKPVKREIVVEEFVAPSRLAESVLERNIGLLLKTKVLLAGKIKEKLQLRRKSLESNESPSSAWLSSILGTHEKKMSITSDMLTNSKFRYTYGLTMTPTPGSSPAPNDFKSESMHGDGSVSISIGAATNKTQLSDDNASRVVDGRGDDPRSRLTSASKYPADRRRRHESATMVHSNSSVSELTYASMASRNSQSSGRSKVFRVTTGRDSRLKNNSFLVGLSFADTGESLASSWKYNPEEMKHVNSMIVNGTFDFNPHLPVKRIERKQKVPVPYPINITGGSYEEFLFDAETLTVHLSFVQNDRDREHISVHISSLHVTPSTRHSDMVVLRSPLVQAGYICSIPAFHWAYIEHEIGITVERLAASEANVQPTVAIATSTVNMPAPRSSEPQLQPQPVPQPEPFFLTETEDTGQNQPPTTQDPVADNLQLSEIDLKQQPQLEPPLQPTVDKEEVAIAAFSYRVKNSNLYQPTYADIEKSLGLAVMNATHRPVVPFEHEQLVSVTATATSTILQAIGNKLQTTLSVLPMASSSAVADSIASNKRDRQQQPAQQQSQAVGYITKGDRVSFVLTGMTPPVAAAPPSRAPLERSPRLRTYRSQPMSFTAPSENEGESTEQNFVDHASNTASLSHLQDIERRRSSFAMQENDQSLGSLNSFDSRDSDRSSSRRHLRKRRKSRNKSSSKPASSLTTRQTSATSADNSSNTDNDAGSNIDNASEFEQSSISQIVDNITSVPVSAMTSADVSTSSLPAIVEEPEEFFPEETKAIILIETSRLMQLYLAKKFLQLDIVVDVQTSFQEAHDALSDNPEIYGIILINVNELLQFPEEVDDPLECLVSKLNALIPARLERNRYTVVIYGALSDEDELLAALQERYRIEFMNEPYTITLLKEIVASHVDKVEALGPRQVTPAAANADASPPPVTEPKSPPLRMMTQSPSERSTPSADSRGNRMPIINLSSN